MKVSIDKQIKFCFDCGSFCGWVGTRSYNQTKKKNGYIFSVNSIMRISISKAFTFVQEW
jgi:hypothetical protein